MSIRQGMDIAKLRKLIAAMEARIVALEARIEVLEQRRGPGRPPKTEPYADQPMTS